MAYSVQPLNDVQGGAHSFPVHTVLGGGGGGLGVKKRSDPFCAIVFIK